MNIRIARAGLVVREVAELRAPTGSTASATCTRCATARACCGRSCASASAAGRGSGPRLASGHRPAAGAERQPERARSLERRAGRSRRTRLSVPCPHGKRAIGAWRSASRRRPDVAVAELHPRVGGVVARLRREPDHHLGLVALLAQQPVEDERAREAARAQRAEVQAAVHRQAQQRRRICLGANLGATELPDEGGQGARVRPARTRT